ncbi:unnamed protein product [Phytophthora lilii]|uniref:Unnamed protein product n=1 Tax=Phytophthora lilii TaxID=2077276 RepID=A0A9W6U4I1_9STRA|nr:unnamed protein product [Phytophthora lilii]
MFADGQTDSAQLQLKSAAKARSKLNNLGQASDSIQNDANLDMSLGEMADTAPRLRCIERRQGRRGGHIGIDAFSKQISLDPQPSEITQAATEQLRDSTMSPAVPIVLNALSWCPSSL